MSTLTHPEQQTTQDTLQLNGPITLSFTSATHDKPPTFTAWPWGLAWWRMRAQRPASATAPPTCWSRARFGLCSPPHYDPTMKWRAHIRLHGDGVRDVALCVDDARLAWKEAVRRGARSVREPFESADEHGKDQDGFDRHLRGHDPQLCGAQPLSRTFSARLSRDCPRPPGPAHRAAACGPRSGQLLAGTR